MERPPPAPFIKRAPSDVWHVYWRVSGRSRSRSLKTTDQDTAERLLAAFAASLGDTPAGRAWQGQAGDWTPWISRQTRILLKQPAFSQDTPAQVREMLGDRLRAQGYRCAASGVVLKPAATDAAGNGLDPHSAVLYRPDTLRPWGFDNLRVVSQIVARILPFGKDSVDHLAVSIVRFRRLQRVRR